MKKKNKLPHTKAYKNARSNYVGIMLFSVLLGLLFYINVRTTCEGEDVISTIIHIVSYSCLISSTVSTASLYRSFSKDFTRIAGKERYEGWRKKQLRYEEIVLAKGKPLSNDEADELAGLFLDKELELPF